VLCALVVAGGLSCAEVRDPPDASPRRDALGPSAEAGHGNNLPPCSAEEAVPLDPVPADVLILLDRSGSMGTAFGAGTRYDAVASTLAEVVAAYGQHVRFGYQELPGRQGCEGQGLDVCCVSPPVLGIGADGAAVVGAIQAAAPVEGSTPLAATLQAALGYFSGLGDTVENRYVLLATDGAPTCTLTGALASGEVPSAPACADALAVVAALAAVSVRVIVLGVGPNLADDVAGGGLCLDALAHAGGAAASPGSPGYYVAGNPEQLHAAIAQIFGGVTRPSCVFRPFSPEDNTEGDMAVFIDGQRIPRDKPDGWSLVESSPKEAPFIRITGVYCDQIRSFAVREVKVHYDCRVCVDVTECISDEPRQEAL
jgi:hypothetical protein